MIDSAKKSGSHEEAFFTTEDAEAHRGSTEGDTSPFLVTPNPENPVYPVKNRSSVKSGATDLFNFFKRQALFAVSHR